MGKAHCLNKKIKKIKENHKRESCGWFGQQPKSEKKKTGKRVLRRRKKGVRVLIILQDGRPNNVGFGSYLMW